MMSETEMHGRDNDWYCIINNKPVHIASMGGGIPEKFRDINYLRKIQKSVSLIPRSTDVEPHYQFINSQIEEGYDYLQDVDVAQIVMKLNQENPCFNLFPDWNLAMKLYACTFLEKAQKGFFSYALIDGETNRYHLVASPVQPLNIDDYDSLDLRPLQQYQNEGFPEEIIINV